MGSLCQLAQMLIGMLILVPEWVKKCRKNFRVFGYFCLFMGLTLLLNNGYNNSMLQNIGFSGIISLNQQSAISNQQSAISNQQSAISNSDYAQFSNRVKYLIVRFKLHTFNVSRFYIIGWNYSAFLYSCPCGRVNQT